MFKYEQGAKTCQASTRVRAAASHALRAASAAFFFEAGTIDAGVFRDSVTHRTQRRIVAHMALWLTCNQTESGLVTGVDWDLKMPTPAIFMRRLRPSGNDDQSVLASFYRDRGACPLQGLPEGFNTYVRWRELLPAKASPAQIDSLVLKPSHCLPPITQRCW